jgi:uncharacterized protein YbbC (DUF1343 family)
MASIVIDDKEFSEIVIAYLLDNVVHDKIPEDMTSLKKLIGRLKQGGMGAILLKEYLETNSNTRYKYKMIKESLHGKRDDTIVIKQNKRREKK